MAAVKTFQVVQKHTSSVSAYMQHFHANEQQSALKKKTVWRRLAELICWSLTAAASLFTFADAAAAAVLN